jgi:hypothetical protein
MTQRSTPQTPHFTIFRSAADEVATSSARVEWANEGGHMHAESGSIVQSYGDTRSLKVVFKHANGDVTEQACTTIREGEAIIRRNTPTPPNRDASRDHDESADGSGGSQ